MVETGLEGNVIVVTGANHGIGATIRATVSRPAIRRDAASHLEEARL
jgi:NAD(P)-dependent dehydrogenase (short-subunit alcohol dehydrogenase family)